MSRVGHATSHHAASHASHSASHQTEHASSRSENRSQTRSVQREQRSEPTRTVSKPTYSPPQHDTVEISDKGRALAAAYQKANKPETTQQARKQETMQQTQKQEKQSGGLWGSVVSFFSNAPKEASGLLSKGEHLLHDASNDIHHVGSALVSDGKKAIGYAKKEEGKAVTYLKKEGQQIEKDVKMKWQQVKHGVASDLKKVDQTAHNDAKDLRSTAIKAYQQAMKDGKQIKQDVKQGAQDAGKALNHVEHSKVVKAVGQFVEGAADSASSNVTYGIISPTAEKDTKAYEFGRVAGDMVSMLGGGVEAFQGASAMGDGGAIAIGGTAFSGGTLSEVAIPAGAAVATAGAVLTVHGAATVYKSAGNLAKDTQQLFSNNGTEGSGKPPVPTKTDAGSDPSSYVYEHAAKKHIFDPNTPSTQSRTQYGKDVDVKQLVNDTKNNPDSVEHQLPNPPNGKKGTTVYKKEYGGNISTDDTPTGSHRVIDNHDKPNKSTHFPYAGGNK